MTTRLDPPQPVVEIAERLEKAGHEAWCVGGAVRDALLGHPHLDWDLATSAKPAEVQRLFRRTVPVGVEFGTVGVFDRTGIMHEVTTFRRDVQTDGRHAVVEFGASLDDDLARRDFTINAIAWSPTRSELRDPFAGRRDLSNKVLRAVGEADARMREDRLRALRAIRFAARLGFAIEAGTWRAILDSAAHLGRLSAERVKQEIDKTLEQVRMPSRAFTLWRDAGIFKTLIPALATVADVDLAAIDCAAQPASGPRSADRRLLRLALLFAPTGAQQSAKSLKALRYSNQDIAWASAIIDRRLLAEELLDHGSDTKEQSRAAQIRRFVSRCGRLRVRSAMRLAAARWAARRHAGLHAPSSVVVHALYRNAIRTAFRDPVELSDLAIDGDDLRHAGFAPGPILGKILQALLDWVLEDPTRNTPELLLPRAVELREKAGPGE